MVTFFRVISGLVPVCLIGAGVSVVYAEEEVVPSVAVGVSRDIQEKEQKLKEKVFAKFSSELRMLKKNCAEANDAETAEKLRSMLSTKQFPKESTLAIPFEFFHGAWQSHNAQGDELILRFDGSSVKGTSSNTPNQWAECGRVVLFDSSSDRIIFDGKPRRIWLKLSADEVLQVSPDGKLCHLSRSAEWQSPSRQFAQLVKKMRNMYRGGKKRLRVSQIADLKKKQELWKKEHQYAASVWAEKKIQAFSAYVSAPEKIGSPEESLHHSEDLLDDVHWAGTWIFPEGKLIVQDVSVLRFSDQKGKGAILEETGTHDSTIRFYRVKDTKTKLFASQAVYAVVFIEERLYLAPTVKDAPVAFIGSKEDVDDFLSDESDALPSKTSSASQHSSSEIRKLEDEFGEP